jgi:hypothetical protein
VQGVGVTALHEYPGFSLDGWHSRFLESYRIARRTQMGYCEPGFALIASSYQSYRFAFVLNACTKVIGLDIKKLFELEFAPM